MPPVIPSAKGNPHTASLTPSLAVRARDNHRAAAVIAPDVHSHLIMMKQLAGRCVL